MPYYHFACKVDRQGFGHGLYLRPRERIMLLDSASSGPVRCFARFREALRLRTLGEMHMSPPLAVDRFMKDCV